MHCLPADITDINCKADEVSAEVFERYRIPTYHEASYKPFAISALMFLTRLQNPGEKLQQIVELAQKLSLWIRFFYTFPRITPLSSGGPGDWREDALHQDR